MKFIKLMNNHKIYTAAVKLTPILLGYFPIGVSFAIIAAEAGLTAAEIISMSIFVVAGASQLAALPVIEVGGGLFYVFVLTWLINIRHAVLSASLAPALHSFSNRELAVFCYGLTDEAFTIHALDIERKQFNKQTAIAINLGVHLIWVAATAVGCYVGFMLIETMEFIRLEFALPALFAGIIALFIKHKIAPPPTSSEKQSMQKQSINLKSLIEYVGIVLLTVTITLLLWFGGWTSLAFVMPAIGAAVVMFAINQIKAKRALSKRTLN